MSFWSLLKQLKKRLRRSRRRLSLGFWILLIVVAAVIAGIQYSGQEDIPVSETEVMNAASILEEKAGDTEPSEPGEEVVRILEQENGDWNVTVHKIYVCGEQIEQKGNMNSAEVIRLLRTNPQFTVDMRDDQVVLFEQVEDLSPQCKESAYFGIDSNGNLTLFNGLPTKENVIRTFFQLNIEHLESSLPRQTIRELHEGIRIKDYAEYNSVLSTFSDFAVDVTENVMKPAP